MDVSQLKRIPLFAEVPDEALAKIAPFATLEEWPEGKEIVQEGGFSNHFYAIESGSAKVEREGEHLADLNEGDIFGEQGLLEHSERSATVTSTVRHQADQDRALGALPDEEGDARGLRRARQEGRGAQLRLSSGSGVAHAARHLGLALGVGIDGGRDLASDARDQPRHERQEDDGG